MYRILYQMPDGTWEKSITTFNTELDAYSAAEYAKDQMGMDVKYKVIPN